MNVLHVITSLDQGGAENALYRLICYDKNNKHTVISLTGLGVYGNKISMEGAVVYDAGMKKGQFKIKSFIKLVRLIKSSKPDVVQTWMYHADLLGGLAAKFASCKSIVWGLHNFNISKTALGASTSIIVRICAFFSNLVPTKIISCSSSAVSVHLQIGYNKKKFEVIPLGYDLSVFKENTNDFERIRGNWGIKPNGVVLGCVARWDKQKDHRNFFKAISILRRKGYHFSAVFIGSEMKKENEELAKLLKSLNLDKDKELYFLGPSSNVPQVLNGMTIHVLSSIGEAFPNVVAESMSCGVPCVVTNVGDSSFIVNNFGWVVKPSDSEELASAIESAILEKNNNPDAWQQRKNNCRKHIEQNFSVEKMVFNYNAVWNSL